MAQWPKTRMTLLERLHDHEDKVAWQEFVELYGPLVYGFAYKRLPQDADAADVMQEVLLAFANGGFGPEKGRFHKWLLTVILNKVRDCCPSANCGRKPSAERTSRLSFRRFPTRLKTIGNTNTAND